VRRAFRRIYSFDYMRHKKWWFAISSTVIGIGIVAMFVNGGGVPWRGFNYGLEFRSGTRVDIAFNDRTIDVAQVRAAVTSAGYPDAVVQQVTVAGGAPGFQIQVKTLDPAQEQALKATLSDAFNRRATVTAYEVQTVGPTFGKEVASASYKAIAIALLLILVYISLRFEWKFALGAILAEVHDLLVVLGVYALTGREVTTATIAAVLTILGYSLYDTVIIYDRIRENAPKMRRVPYADMVNRSIWETLTRSINTTMTTIIPVLCLLLFGGSTLKDFAFALLVGISSGAYSSIFVASPFLCWLKEREPQNRKLAARAQQGVGSAR
jgi:SecD/SecF fusion protein